MVEQVAEQAGHALRIAIVGRKGGSAKSTTAYNLAGALAARGRHCLIVDLDSQASLTRALSDDPVAAEEGIGFRIAEPEHGLGDIIRPIGPAIDLAPGNRSIEAAATALAQNATGPLRLRFLLREVTDRYEAIIIDTAPALGSTQDSALLAADIAIVPARPGAQTDIDALDDIFKVRQELCQYGFAAAEIAAILPSDYDATHSPDRAGLLYLEETYGLLVAAPVPQESREVRSKFDRGDDRGKTDQVPGRQTAGRSGINRADGPVGTGGWGAHAALPPVAVDRSRDETGVTDPVDRDAADVVRGVRALVHRDAALDEVSLRLLREAAGELTAFLASRAL